MEQENMTSKQDFYERFVLMWNETIEMVMKHTARYVNCSQMFREADAEIERLRTELGETNEALAACQSQASALRLADEPPAALTEYARNRLRALVDDAWNAATESTQVPHTDWADEIIDKWATDGAPALPEPPSAPRKDHYDRMYSLVEDMATMFNGRPSNYINVANRIAEEASKLLNEIDDGLSPTKSAAKGDG